MTFRIRLRTAAGFDEITVEAPSATAALQDRGVVRRLAFSLLGVWQLTSGTWAAGTWQRIDTSSL